MGKQLSEKQVYQQLHISSLDQITPEKMGRFIAMLPNMPKDVAMKMIDSVSAIAQFGSMFMQQSSIMLDGILKTNDLEAAAIHDNFKKALDALSKNLEKNTDKPAVQEKIRQEIKDLIEMEMGYAAENREFKKGLLDVLGSVAKTIG